MRAERAWQPSLLLRAREGVQRAAGAARALVEKRSGMPGIVGERNLLLLELHSKLRQTSACVGRLAGLVSLPEILAVGQRGAEP